MLISDKVIYQVQSQDKTLLNPRQGNSLVSAEAERKNRDAMIDDR